jgi:hypothetical protein
VPTSGGAGAGAGTGVVNSCDQLHCVHGNCRTNFAGGPVCICHNGYTGMTL